MLSYICQTACTIKCLFIHLMRMFSRSLHVRVGGSQAVTIVRISSVLTLLLVIVIKLLKSESILYGLTEAISSRSVVSFHTTRDTHLRHT